MSYVVTPNPRGFILVHINSLTSKYYMHCGETALDEIRSLPSGACSIIITQGGELMLTTARACDTGAFLSTP